MGADLSIGRQVAECHYKACLFAGIDMRSFCSDKALSEWKYKIGPCETLKACDDLWISRFILHRVAAHFDITVKFELNDTLNIPNTHPIKPYFSHNTSSILFSTREMNANKNFM